MAESKAFDLLLFGASGFTGRRVARRLALRAPAGLRLAWCGRDRSKLEKLAEDLGRGEVLLADSEEPASVDRAVEQTRVVLSTAGPFALYGDPLVDACVRHRVHYADITGEVAWVRRVIERHHLTAKQQGTFLVPFCGFDSVPADLAVLALVDAARQMGGSELGEVTGVYRLRGGLNGGTWATLLNLSSSESARELADPFLLVPGYQPDRAEVNRQKDPTAPEIEAGSGAPLAPFFMGPINRRVVMRSDALLGYGSALCYFEYQALDKAPEWTAKVLGWTQRLAGLTLRLPIGQSLARRFGPQPGQGPSEKTIEHGHSRLDCHGITTDGRRLSLSLDAPGDPGNAVTSRCLVECALMLAEEGQALGLGQPDKGGVLTPASAFGLPLLARLERHGDFQVRWSGA